MRSITLLIFCLLLFSRGWSQSPVIVPGNTGYAVPAESKNMFSGDGVQGWTDTRQQLSYFFYAHKAGDLSIGLNARNAVAGSILQVAVAGQKFLVRVPASRTFKSVGAGTVHLRDSGFYSITISALKKSGTTIADIQSIFLSGPPSSSLHFNTKPRRNAASVHLKYPLADSVKAIYFYNELTVPAGYDPVHSYYMACGFARGYFGMQVNSA
ncbi:MAG: DUF5077 domain-containing protein, partial [Chitinophagaceae bacterium]|nr:DUF5077 domain-containing protein [Chitinophagaceae bacterium]